MVGLAAHWATALIFVELYAYTEYPYADCKNHLPWEVLVGMLFATSILSTHRLTSSLDIRRSWTIDGLHVIVSLGFEIFAGHIATSQFLWKCIASLLMSFGVNAVSD